MSTLKMYTDVIELCENRAGRYRRELIIERNVFMLSVIGVGNN